MSSYGLWEVVLVALLTSLPLLAMVFMVLMLAMGHATTQLVRAGRREPSTSRPRELQER